MQIEMSFLTYFVLAILLACSHVSGYMYSGDMISTLPESLDVDVFTDCTNPGHVILIITWNISENTNEEYEVELNISDTENRHHCQQLNFTEIPNIVATQQTLEIRPQNSHTHPAFDCDYIFTLYSAADSLSIQFNTNFSDPNPRLEYNCDAMFDPETLSYNLNLEWIITPTNCLVAAAIQSFNITLLQSDIISETITLKPDIDNEVQQLYKVSFPNQTILYNEKYKFQLTTESSNRFPFYNSLSSLTIPSCSVAALPVPPEPITHIHIAEYTYYSNTATLKAVWRPPIITHGKLGIFHILVGERGTSSVLYETTIPANQLYLDIIFPVDSNNDHLYLQIRTTNIDCQKLSIPCFSDWSDPVYLNKTTCSTFTHVNTLTRPFSKEQDALTHARCYAICVDEFVPEIVNSLISNSIWPSVTQDNLTCYQLTKVTQCYRGCIVKFKKPEEKNYICADHCVTECKSGCDGEVMCELENERCNRKCKAGPCGKGCRRFSSLDDTDADIPVPPKGYPIIKPTSAVDGGEFQVYLEYTQTEETPTPHDHTFLIKLQQEDGTVHYKFQPSLSRPLNLTYFNCEIITVSIAVVTSSGKSKYSDTTTLYIYGETIFPSHPNTSSIQVLLLEDFRPKFFRHAIMTLTWDTPKNYELVESYVVEIISRSKNCGGTGKSYEYTVERNSTSITIQSERKRRPPFFRCVYRVKIYSIPSRPDDTPGFRFIPTNTVSGEQPELKLQCLSTQDIETGLIYVYAAWSVPFDEALLQAGNVFTVFTDFVVNNSSGRSDADHIFIPFSLNKTQYGTPFVLTPVTNDADNFWIKVRPERKPSFEWRLWPEEQICFVSARSLPPTTVENTTVHVIEISDSVISIYVNWSPPTKSYGTIKQYEIVLYPMEMLPLQTAAPTYIYTQENEVTVNETNRFPPQVMCFYVQVRAFNNYTASNYSDKTIVGRKGANCVEQLLPSPSLETSLYSTIEILPSSPSTSFLVIEPVSISSNTLFVTIIPIGGVLLIIVLIIFLLLLIICINYRKKRSLKIAFEGEMTSEWITGKKKDMNGSGLDADEWELLATDIVVDNMLSNGVFGKVYKGYLRGPVNNKKVPHELRKCASIPVAVKMLKEEASGNEKNDFLQEIDLMKKIAEGNSPHVVNMVGCVTIQEPIMLLTAFVKHGDLLHYLEHIRKHLIESSSQYPEYTQVVPDTETSSPYATLRDISPVDLLSFAYQIASGMEYLANLGILHRDLAARNVLVEDDKTLKISDFGMSRMTESDHVYVKNARGRLPWKWMAIESILSREFTSASDVWSFGVTLWEIATLGGFPYPSVPNAELLTYLQQGNRLDKPKNASSEVYDIMMLCWQENTTARPNFTQLRNKFDGLVSAENSTDAPYIDLSVDLSQPYYYLYDIDLFAILTDNEEVSSINEENVLSNGTEPHQYDHLSDDIKEECL